jgi:hypothetical protein
VPSVRSNVLHDIPENTANFPAELSGPDSGAEQDCGTGVLASLVAAEFSTRAARRHLWFDTEAAMVAQANLDGRHALVLLESAWSGV